MTPSNGRLSLPIAVGLTVPSSTVPAWIADTARAILETGDATIVGVTVSVPGATRRRRLRPVRAAVRAYAWLDALVFGRRDDAARTVDISGLLDATVRGPSFSERPPD